MIMANTIQDKLAYLEETKGLIKEAIIAKGVSISDVDTFRSYASKIEVIQAGGSIAGAPSGMKFANSTFTTVPQEIFPYLEQQTDLSGIFRGCKSLTTVSLFDTSKAINMHYMFYYCTSLTSVPQFDTSNVNDMGSMFYNCQKLRTVPLFNTSNATDISSMFSDCTSLQTVPQFDTSKTTNMSSMFSDCTSLQTVPQFDTSKTTNMSYMFSGCTSLTSVPQFNASNATNMSYMFSGCQKLQTVQLLNTSNVTNMSNMFYNCKELQTVPLLNVSNVNNMDSMFYYCTSLTNLGGFTGLKKGLDLSYSPLLTVDSVMNVITNASDMTSSHRTLALHKDVFNKLSQEQISTANAKGWNIVSK